MDSAPSPKIISLTEIDERRLGDTTVSTVFLASILIVCFFFGFDDVLFAVAVLRDMLCLTVARVFRLFRVYRDGRNPEGLFELRESMLKLVLNVCGDITTHAYYEHEQTSRRKEKTRAINQNDASRVNDRARVSVVGCRLSVVVSLARRLARGVCRPPCASRLYPRSPRLTPRGGAARCSSARRASRASRCSRRWGRCKSSFTWSPDVELI